MIPRSERSMERAPIPEEMWAPDPEEDLNLDGLGCYFHETFLLTGISWQDAADLLDREREAIELLASIAATPAEFDGLAGMVECGDVEAAPPDLEPIMSDVPEFGGLDLGVAALCWALCAAGTLTVVSCRGHTPPPEPWSRNPVVRFVADATRASLMLHLAETQGCGLLYEGKTLRLETPSVLEAMDLAQAILARADEFDRLPLPGWVQAANEVED